MLKIEYGIPMPKGNRMRKESIGQIVPWDQLQVGQSVLIPRLITSTYSNPCGTITGTAHQHGMRVSIRTERHGIRIWRTA